MSKCIIVYNTITTLDTLSGSSRKLLYTVVEIFTPYQMFYQFLNMKTPVLHLRLCIWSLAVLNLRKCWLHNWVLFNQNFIPFLITQSPSGIWSFSHSNMLNLLTLTFWNLDIWRPTHTHIYKGLNYGFPLTFRWRSPWRPWYSWLCSEQHVRHYAMFYELISAMLVTNWYNILLTICHLVPHMLFQLLPLRTIKLSAGTSVPGTPSPIRCPWMLDTTSAAGPSSPASGCCLPLTATSRTYRKTQFHGSCWISSDGLYGDARIHYLLFWWFCF